MDLKGEAGRWSSSLLVSGKLCVSLGQSLCSLPAGGEHMERDTLCRLGLRTPQEGILDGKASAKGRAKAAPSEYTKSQGAKRLSPLDTEFHSILLHGSGGHTAEPGSQHQSRVFQLLPFPDKVRCCQACHRWELRIRVSENPLNSSSQPVGHNPSGQSLSKTVYIRIYNSGKTLQL